MDKKLDVRASYPNGGLSYNTGRRTTKREMSSIEGKDENEIRMQNMGLTSGHVNGLEYVISMFNAPKPFEALEMFKQDLQNKKLLINE